jgi:enterochelin esterase-like enzyme
MRRTLGLLIVLALLAGCSNASSWPFGQPPKEPSPTIVPSATSEPTRTPLPSSTPTPSATPTPTCQNPAGTVLETSYIGGVVREPFNVRVFLPPCYEVSEQDYPVLYLLHGSPYDETHWDQLGADEVAGAAMQEGSWPPFIMVMPYATTILFTGTDGGEWSYEGEFVQGLVPWTDQNFRTRADPTMRGFAGISRGGIWALEITLLHADLIDSVAAVSPAFMMNAARPMYDPFELIYRGEPRPHRILLVAGEADWARQDTERFSQALDLLGISHELIIVPGKHEDETWSQIMEEVLGFFASAWNEGSGSAQ